jgi:hypothetical protein
MCWKFRKLKALWERFPRIGGALSYVIANFPHTIPGTTLPDFWQNLKAPLRCQFERPGRQGNLFSLCLLAELQILTTLQEKKSPSSSSVSS